MHIKIAKNENEILQCWEVMFALRPHLEKATFVSTIQEMMSEGYRLAYIAEEGVAVSAIGFRYMQYLYNGKHFYIDDLSTLPSVRGKGYAGRLIDYVVSLAKINGYKLVTLDSGHQRFVAHKLYLNKGFQIASHHFSKTVEEEK
jgi:GNAT superfamily N-acetyltransferase